MATNQTHSSADPLTALLEKFRAMPDVPVEGFFAYSVKIVCGKQTGENWADSNGRRNTDCVSSMAATRQAPLPASSSPRSFSVEHLGLLPPR